MTYAKEVRKALRDVRFPASRADLIREAFQYDRRPDLRALLDKIPDRTYYSLAEVDEESRRALERWPVQRRLGPSRRPARG